MSTAIWDEGHVFIRLPSDTDVSAVLSRYDARIMRDGRTLASAPIEIAPGDVATFESTPAYTPEGLDYRRYVLRLRGRVAVEWADEPVRTSRWRRAWDRLTTWDVRPRVLRRAMALMAFGAILAGTGVGWAANAEAAPDPYWPIPPVWCPGGGTMTGWGGYCDGKPYPDNTKWHMDSFVAPFVGRVWNPIVCVVANAPAPPPLAGPGGCGGAV